MPNIWTHIIFAEKLSDELPLLSFSKEEQAYYRYGSQGPDPFFYHNFWPWKKSTVPQIGLNIHYQHCGPFLMNMIMEGKKAIDSRINAYILGFITHHILDRTTHPYIIYRSGEERYKHQLLETTIDTLMVKRIRHLDTWEHPAYKQIYVGKTILDSLESFLQQLIKIHFPDSLTNIPTHFVNESYQDMLKAFTFFHDPSGLKNKLLFGKITPFSHRKSFPKADYLNEKKLEWLHPTDDQETSCSSFLELFEEALHEGKEILLQVQEYWLKDDLGILSELKDKIKNVSYDTGKDSSVRDQLLYFDPIV
ncbi:zinc dependent phospholipase C family protein [Bacillus sp. 2205SS5-2]|uniref:zinc dependent phospholipase C family protein n=1 Tax=Bacillus sp. 2205SS5-2 TaxID=3109031 RepID=UPI003004F218